jgi:hypothetical protein
MEEITHAYRIMANKHQQKKKRLLGIYGTWGGVVVKALRY